MIHSIEINDLTRSNFEYVSDNKSGKMDILSNTKTFEFKKGLNLIIGENGSGKSTLINMLSFYTFCDTGESKLSLGLNDDSINKFINNNDLPCDGINVVNDYRFKVFKLVLENTRSEENTLDNFTNFANFFNSRTLSEGENLVFGIQNVFKRMFSGNLVFDHSALVQKVNDTWKKYQDTIKKYIKLNQFSETDATFTLLMDEPDRNLDIKNVNQVLEVLSNTKENGQTIASIHNPLLIYKLSKLENINLIELTEGYQKSVIKTVESLLK